MKISLLIFFLLNSIFIFGKDNNVLFGERNLLNSNLAVYFDKEGSPYPNYFISNASLDSCYASLNVWYSKHPQDLINISKRYKCANTKFSPQNIKTLNDSILSSIRQSINNKKANFSSVTFLIHGYRKPFVSLKGDKTSPQDFQTMRHSIEKFSTSKACFVEVYWDALYCSKYTETDDLFPIFEQSVKIAIPVGHSFRLLINDLKYDTLNIYTHSLGAKVANYALFNSDEFSAPTPSNKRVNICFVAPAIAGNESYINYYIRQSTVNFKTKDNYKLAILYNEEDFVLLKKVGMFGPGPYKYGVTSLGCNYENTAIKLKLYFVKYFPNSPIEIFDISKVGGCHLVTCYFAGDNLKEAVKYLSK